MRIGRRIIGLLVGAALLVALTTTAYAGEVKKPARTAKKVKKDDRLALKKMHGFEWHAGWKAAVTANRKSPEEARPIFFLRILGDLDGGS